MDDIIELEKIEDLLKMDTLPDNFGFKGLLFKYGGGSASPLKDYLDRKQILTVNYFTMSVGWKGVTPSYSFQMVYRIERTNFIPDRIEWGA